MPVALLLDIEPMRLIIHDEYDEMFVVAEIFYQLQWQDQRLFTHPCSGALPEMLSFNKEAGRSDNARFAKDQLLQRFWTLRIDGTSLVPGYDVFDESAIVQTDRNTSWVAGFAPEGAVQLASTASRARRRLSCTSSNRDSTFIIIHSTRRF